MRWLMFFVLLSLEVCGVWYVGELIGSLGLAIWMAVGTSFVGLWLIGQARQGLDPQTLMQRMAGESQPERKIADLLAPLVGAILLVLPGFLTDALGLLLVFPPTRRLFAKAARKVVMGTMQRRMETMMGGAAFDTERMRRMFEQQGMTFPGGPPAGEGAPQPGASSHPGDRGPVRDADFEVLD
ncbi:MAG: hypothetical protein CMJ83_18615 [Planctomycetes bacterium]|jgi:UPF0716 protein FxsA|nr:hypothetical protein [Planctomycetota bacterium]